LDFLGSESLKDLIFFVLQGWIWIAATERLIFVDTKSVSVWNGALRRKGHEMEAIFSTNKSDGTIDSPSHC
jgi:hypothetical protein